MRHIAKFGLFLFVICSWSLAQSVIHVDANRGSDAGDGSPNRPFKSLTKATQSIPAGHKHSLSIRIHPGDYTLHEPIELSQGEFNAKNTLTIEAHISPDDPQWTPAQMPVIRSSEHPGQVEGRGKAIYGFWVKISHVHFRGLRFTGNPAVGHRYYPIRRDDNKLKDLKVSQCLFEGDREKAPIHVAIIARGHGMVVEHNIFKQCRNPTVFWMAEGGNSYGNAFRYNIAYDSYQSGLWTTDTASDFEFSNNVFLGGNVFHIHRFARESFYSFENSYVVGFQSWTRLSGGPGGSEAPHPAPLTIREHKIFREADIQFEKDDDGGKNRRWLHLSPNSPGHHLGAGLFKP